VDWDATVDVLGPKLFRYFCARVHQAHAADLVQETLLRLVQKVDAGQFDPGRGPIVAYAFGIAHFVYKESVKARRLEIVTTVDDAGVAAVASSAPLSDAVAEEHAMTASLRRAISALPDAEQNIITLLLDRDLTLPEIAIIVGMPVGTVKSHIHRAKENLKKSMTPSRRSL